MRFHATILLNGKTATGIAVPPDVVEALGGGKKPPVTVTLGEYSYRTTIAPRGERFLIPVSAENRAGSGVAAGDELDVDIELDTAPREVTVPADLADALDADARRTFDALSYSRKQALVLPIQQAKTPETRQRRIAKAVSALREG
jgi:bacteriocin resistance YdeI/OmpD-like protein/uncharacterized protein DUF1905